MLLLVRFVCASAETFVLQNTGQKIMYDMRMQVFRHLHNLAPSFYDKNPVGRLITRVITDVDVLNEMFSAGIVSIFGDILVLAGITVAILLMNWRLGLVTLSVSLVTLWLLVIGLGLFLIGIPPGWEEIARSFVFLLVTIVYAGVWLALALLFSILFRSAATAALVTLGLWLLVTFIWPVLSGALAQIIVPPDPRYTALGLQTPATAQLRVITNRRSSGARQCRVPYHRPPTALPKA